jgi:hypothetical protein
MRSIKPAVWLAGALMLGTVAGANAQAPEPKGPVAKPLLNLDLAPEMDSVEGRAMRMQLTAYEPGASNKPHSHKDRPEVVYPFPVSLFVRYCHASVISAIFINTRSSQCHQGAGSGPDEVVRSATNYRSLQSTRQGCLPSPASVTAPPRGTSSPRRQPNGHLRANHGSISRLPPTYSPSRKFGAAPMPACARTERISRRALSWRWSSVCLAIAA